MNSILQKTQQEQPIIADDTQGKANITVANNCQLVLMTPQESNTNNVLNDKITTSINNRSLQQKTDLTNAPTLRLTDGTIVNDYSHDINFVTRMELMSLEEAETIRTQVNKYPNEYPMPHMKFTRDKIISSICKLKTQHELTKEEIEIFNKIEIELKNISPRYPYKKSLIITYKFLLCKSFLEFKFEMKSLNPLQNNTHFTLFNASCNKYYKEAMKLINSGIHRLSMFVNDCSMLKIQELPWDEFLNNNINFANALEKIYFSATLYDAGIVLSGFQALSSNEVLIPYTDELSVSFFNKTWWLPLWLLGCSTDQELTVADGFTMGSSEFFEHDLFHLSLKLYKLSKKQIYFQDLFNQIKFIYQHQNLIQQVKFEAIELAIFFIFHEVGLLSSDSSIVTVNQFLKLLYKISDIAPFADLPVEYKDITSLDLRIAIKWLTLMLSEEYINMEITDAIFKANEMKDTVKFEDTARSCRVFHYSINHAKPIIIDKTIECIKNNQEYLARNNLNASCLVAAMRLYKRSVQVNPTNGFSTPEINTDNSQTLNEDLLISVNIDKYEKEAKWIICFLQTDVSLSERERCEIACEKFKKQQATVK